MNIEPDKKRLAGLDLTGIKLNDAILFCPKCDFQIVHATMNPICPDCGCGLHVTHVDFDLFILVGLKANETAEKRRRKKEEKLRTVLGLNRIHH